MRKNQPNKALEAVFLFLVFEIFCHHQLLIKSMRHNFLCFLFSMMCFETSAQSLPNTWWMGGKMGRNYADVSKLQKWALSEGVSDVPGSTSNSSFGFDIAHQRGRIPFQFSSEFDLPKSYTSAPYFFSFNFQSGYSWHLTPKLEVQALGGVGLGYSIIRFRTTPNSLQSLPYNHSEAFARSSLFLYKTTMQVTRTIGWDHFKKWRPMFVGSIGYQGKISQSAYRYGVNEQDIDGNYMVGEIVGIPKFYRGNLFFSVGIWFRLTTTEIIH